jgi:hypothetical protein
MVPAAPKGRELLTWIIKLFPLVLTSLPPYTTAFPTDSSQLLHTMTTPINSDKKGNEP